MSYQAIKSEGEGCQGAGQRKATEAEVYPLKLQVCEQASHTYPLKLDQSSLKFYPYNRYLQVTILDHYGACLPDRILASTGLLRSCRS
jgi:hypothetical protein